MGWPMNLDAYVIFSIKKKKNEDTLGLNCVEKAYLNLVKIVVFIERYRAIWVRIAMLCVIS